MSNITKHQVTSRNLVLSIVLNIAITLSQIIGGIISGSLALISDAIHNFSDVVSLLLSFFAHKLSRKKASIQQTFGFKRAEIIAAFINASTLIIVAFYLIYEAIHKFFNPEPIEASLVVWLALLGVVFNGVSVLLLQNDAKHNLNMRSAYVHLFTDMLASVAVLIGGLLMYWYQWFWVDSVLTFAIAIYLIVVGLDLLKKSTQILMLFTPSNIDIKEIVREVHQIPGVGKLHHIHVWLLNEDELHLEAHLDCEKDIRMSEFNDLLHQIEEVLYEKFNINHVNIQPEFQKADPKDFIVQD
ncbi:MAG: cation transporter [Flavobacteriales bacterium]|nr:cation transporter [Flavobacteriales bacterium]